MAKKDEKKGVIEEAGNGENRVVLRNISAEMKDSYLDYAMSVITSRALPDVRDGLKPVHRRILFAMQQMGLTSSARFRKSAAVVGDVMGKYHPHGDTAIYDSLVQMAQDFKYRYPLVIGQGNFGCFTGDTKIHLIDGRTLSFLELIKEDGQGKKNYTYTYNSKTKTIEIVCIEAPRRTKRKSELVKVTLDNGEEIRCTPDHKFMRRDGSYREAKDLESGESLMPLYTRLSTKEDDTHIVGYEMVLQPHAQKWEYAHHLSDAWNLVRSVYTRLSGKVRHHIDFNKKNNNPENIKRLPWEEHWRIHAAFASERHRIDPEYRQKLAEGRTAYFSSAEGKRRTAENMSKRNREFWKDPVYREARIKEKQKMWRDSAYKARMTERSSKNLKQKWKDTVFLSLMSKNKSREMKERWQDPSYRFKQVERMQQISKEIWTDPNHHAFVSKFMRELWKDDMYREQRIIASRALWNDPHYCAKFGADHFTQAAKKLWENPSTREFHRRKLVVQREDPQFKKLLEAGRSRANKERLDKDPQYMHRLNEKAKIALHSKWQDPEYARGVVRSRILGYLRTLVDAGHEVSPEIYDTQRTHNGIPRFEKACSYFSSLNEMVALAKMYNHKVVGVEFLSEKEDVYDITIDGTHNFSLAAGVFVHNSIDGDPPAAMRYTEAKMARLSGELMRDLEKDTVEWRANYDATRKEPIIFPSIVPSLLLNGTLGIAVGMATNIPPHNIGEIIEATMYLIDNGDATTTEDLLQFIKGPDFPTGGVVFGAKDMHHAYASGRGGIVCRGVAEITENKKGDTQIIITSIPYRVNKADLITSIAALVRDKKLEGIKGLRDESAKQGMRIVIDLKGTARPQTVLNFIYKHTQLEDTFHFNMVALLDGVPQMFTLKSILQEFIIHRISVVKRRTQFDLGSALEREHILLGLKKALDHIDEIIKLIKASKDAPTAHMNLMKTFKFSEKQATAILEMRLQKLAGLERKKIEDELLEVQALIEELRELLASPKKIQEVIKTELKEIGEKYGDERRTKVVKAGAKLMLPEDLISDEESVLVLTAGGYIKRTNPSEYKKQKRGGVGVIDLNTKEEDFVTILLTTTTHSDLLFFTDAGKVYQIKMYDVPEGKRATRGKSIMNFLPLSATEKVTSVLPMPKQIRESTLSLLMVTEQGTVKRAAASSFHDVRRSGLIGITLVDGDRLIAASFVDKTDSIILASAKGQSIRFKVIDVREMGRNAAGVRGIKLGSNDVVIGAGRVEKAAENDELLVLSENGYGKKTHLKEYKIQNRGGSGIKTFKNSSKTGKLMISEVVEMSGDTEVVAMSKKGQVIRVDLSEIPSLGRQTQGVRVMRLRPGDSIASVICL